MIRKNHEQFVLQMQTLSPNIEILTKYEKDSVKVLCRCKTCGFEWWSTPSNLLQGKSCRQCHFKKLGKIKMKSHEQFVEEMDSINSNISFTSP